MNWLRRQEPRKAEDCFQRALGFLPDFPPAHYNLGRLLLRQGRTREAEEHLAEVVGLVPELQPAQLDLALLRLREGRADEAARQLRAALEASQDRGPLYDLLGRVLARQQKWAEAAACLTEALRLGTTDRDGAHRTLAFVLGKLDRRPEANAEYREASRLNPAWPQKAIQTAWSLATDPDPSRRDSWLAVELAEQACEAVGNKEARFFDTLAAAYASVGRYDRAVDVAEQALAASGQTEPTQTRGIQERLELYKKGQPFRQKAMPR
jgi:tetratricopeptide (TPR) repeat protein